MEHITLKLGGLKWQTLTLSEGQEHRYSIAGCPKLKDSREVAVRLSAGAVVSSEGLL